jgi:hypothetical protein
MWAVTKCWLRGWLELAKTTSLRVCWETVRDVPITYCSSRLEPAINKSKTRIRRGKRMGKALSRTVK